MLFITKRWRRAWIIHDRVGHFIANTNDHNRAYLQTHAASVIICLRYSNQDSCSKCIFGPVCNSHATAIHQNSGIDVAVEGQFSPAGYGKQYDIFVRQLIQQILHYECSESTHLLCSNMCFHFSYIRLHPKHATPCFRNVWQVLCIYFINSSLLIWINFNPIMDK